MGHLNLTDKALENQKPPEKGKRRLLWDAQVPGLAARVSHTGRISFVFIKRFPGGPATPVPRKLGDYESMTLAEAREKAREWLRLVDRGIDPQAEAARLEEEKRKEEERLRQEEERNRANIFSVVAEDFIKDKLPGERKGEEVERDIRRDFVPAWGERPITDITGADVKALVRAKKQTAPAQARNLLGIIKRLLAWAVEQEGYGLRINVAEAVKPKALLGKKRRRSRILTDDELRAAWRAACREGYPAGDVYKLLALAALRLNEAARARWSEFPPAVVRALRQRKSGEKIDWRTVSNEPLVWIIPAERMKGEEEEARPHAVPLTADILALLESLPMFKSGDYLFSTTFGKKPVSVGSKIKGRMDLRMLRTLRALARARGGDAAAASLAPWVNHDIRRTVRSNLSRLKVTEEAREAVIAHARPGIKGTYDVYDYADEKREALELWAERMRSIVKPPASLASNVIELAAVRA